MLVKITNSCRMGCTHCSENAIECNEHMTFDTFKQVVSFVNKLKIKTLIITGGEPFDHPQFFSFMWYLKLNLNEVTSVVVTSNGMFLNSPDDIIKANDIGAMIQITNDKRFYPFPVNEENLSMLKNYSYETNIRHVVSVGRAKYNKLEMGPRLGPKCFNIVAVTKQMGSFTNAVHYLESVHKFCTPQINYNGYLKPGEFAVCPAIAHVSEPIEVINESFMEYDFLDCDACDSIKHIEPFTLTQYQIVKNKRKG